ncbi:MAG: hypothetical protein HYX40_07320 [Sphingobacteriales bacterium]|nr:hypothetical protein [Sphingobacteriales bacterium]
MNCKKIIITALLIFVASAKLYSQVFTGKPKNANEAVGRILHQQKIWHLQQLPSNSVLYKFNSKYVTPFYQTTKVYSLPDEKMSNNNFTGINYKFRSIQSDTTINKKIF